MTTPQPSATTTTTTTKRLLHELSAAQSSLPNDSLLSLSPISETNLLHWEAVLRGIPHTAYEGGLWKLRIDIKEGYPHKPPEIRFLTRVCHANVNFVTGEICLDLLKENWSPAYTIASTLESVRILLGEPEMESPLNVEVGCLLREGDQVAVQGLVRFYTGEERWGGV
ncbi:MAG: hypothetical protein M1836_004442 [Candelina mexicana]|nr:MAG: hypothetical protein M1836_004442 [Candelina mexicana]